MESTVNCGKAQEVLSSHKKRLRASITKKKQSNADQLLTNSRNTPVSSVNNGSKSVKTRKLKSSLPRLSLLAEHKSIANNLV